VEPNCGPSARLLVHKEMKTGYSSACHIVRTQLVLSEAVRCVFSPFIPSSHHPHITCITCCSVNDT